MTEATFLSEIESIKKQIEKRLTDQNANRRPIYDGPIHSVKYFASPIKIAWFLKEAYDGENGTGGNWSYEEEFEDSNMEGIIKGSRSTWHPIIYASYGILRNFTLWDEMNFIRDDPSMKMVLGNVAIVNCQKLPAKYRSKSIWGGEIERSVKENGDILQRQIALLNPDIFIFGNTLHLYHELIPFAKGSRTAMSHTNYYIHDRKLYIDACHPSARVQRDIYVDEIISAAKDWSGKLSR